MDSCHFIWFWCHPICLGFELGSRFIFRLHLKIVLKEFDDFAIRRFLRARDLDVDKASAMLLKYLKWKKSFVPNGYISPTEIPNEIAHNKMFLQGVDKLGRPIAVVFGGRHMPNKQGGLEEFKRMCFVLFVCLISYLACCSLLKSLSWSTGFVVLALDKLCSRYTIDYLILLVLSLKNIRLFLLVQFRNQERVYHVVLNLPSVLTHVIHVISQDRKIVILFIVPKRGSKCHYSTSRNGRRGWLASLPYNFWNYSVNHISWLIRTSPGREKFVVIGDLQGFGYSNSDVRAYLGALSILQVYLPVFIWILPSIHTIVQS